MKRVLYLFISCVMLYSSAAAGTAARGQQRAAAAADGGGGGGAARARVLLIPLDDRPPCLQFPVLMGQIGDAEVIAPPRALLGRFLEPGQPERIAAWVRAQNLRSFDAAIISIDMLAYGGLVNSRVHRTALPAALNRLEIVDWLHRRAPHLRIYGSSVIMRLAPTADGRNDSYRDKITRWAELSDATAPDEAALRAEAAQLEREIPAAALADYKLARARNLAVNRASIALVRRKVFDYLILSQDDAKPRGVHVADREQLRGEISRLGLADRITVQPGADEVSMLLLARALNRRFGYAPRIAAIYSSEQIRTSVAPFEDRPLHRTVSFHIAATGSREVSTPEAADLLFYVYGSRAEAGVARRFADQIAAAVERGRRVIVADIDFKGDVQGADPAFTEALRGHAVFPRLAGYAAWNTAGNTIGTALPHGVIAARALQSIARAAAGPRAARIVRAQTKFTLHRLLDDYAYHSLVRPIAVTLARAGRLNPDGLSGADQTRIEIFIRERMQPYIDAFEQDYTGQRAAPGPPGGEGLRTPVTVKITDYRVYLPWGRTFEAEMDFRLDAPLRGAGDRRR